MQARTVTAITVYCVLLASFWVAAQRTSVAAELGSGLPPLAVSFSLMLGTLLWFGLGGAEWLSARLRTRTARVLLTGTAVVPYILSAVPSGVFEWRLAIAFAILPIVFAVLLEVQRSDRLTAADVLVLAVIGLSVVLHWFAAAWPWAGLSGFPKLLLTDVALYLYLIIRRLPGIGYDLRPRTDDLRIGAREWVLFAPIAISLGMALGFLHVHATVPSGLSLVGGLVFTFLFIAIPEEFFFRGVLLNLLESRMRPVLALVVSSVLFGLAHFNKDAVFNWRYVLLASLAGIFYGRAWRVERRIFACAITHTLVDVTWSIWFR